MKIEHDPTLRRCRVCRQQKKLGMFRLLNHIYGPRDHAGNINSVCIQCEDERIRGSFADECRRAGVDLLVGRYREQGLKR